MNVYDFDNTIYKGDASIDFYIFCLRKKPTIMFLLPIQLYSGFKYVLKIITKEQFKRAFFSFLRQIKNVDDLVIEFWDKNHTKIKKWYLNQKKSTDVIISASPQFLLEPICNRLEIKCLIASNIDKNTGEHLSKNCHGEEKVIRYRAIFENKKIDKFYTDSFSDKPLIDISKEAFIVRDEQVIEYSKYKTSFFEKIKHLFLNRDFIVFVFCGGIGTIVNFISSLLISNYINPTISYAFGYGISIFVTYYLNISLIFYRKINIIDFIKFITAYIPNFIILFTFVTIFLNIYHWDKVLVYGLAGLFGIPITYILIKLYALAGGK